MALRGLVSPEQPVADLPCCPALALTQHSTIPAQLKTGAPHFIVEHKWRSCKEQLLGEYRGIMGHLCPSWGSSTISVSPDSVSSPGYESVPYLMQLSKKVKGCGCRKSGLEGWLWVSFPEGKLMGRLWSTGKTLPQHSVLVIWVSQGEIRCEELFLRSH